MTRLSCLSRQRLQQAPPGPSQDKRPGTSSRARICFSSSRSGGVSLQIDPGGIESFPLTLPVPFGIRQFSLTVRRPGPVDAAASTQRDARILWALGGSHGISRNRFCSLLCRALSCGACDLVFSSVVSPYPSLYLAPPCECGCVWYFVSPSARRGLLDLDQTIAHFDARARFCWQRYFALLVSFEHMCALSLGWLDFGWTWPVLVPTRYWQCHLGCCSRLA